jgi:hypothetical protein
MRLSRMTLSIALLVAAVASPRHVAADATSRPAVPADPSTPRGALKALATAMTAGDADAIQRLLLANTPTEQRMVGLMSDMAVSIAQLNKAMIGRFGRKPAAAVLGGDPDETMARSLADLDAATERIDGDTATVGTVSQSFTLKKTANGEWRIAVSEMSKDTTSAQVEEKATVLSGQMKAMHEITTGIAAGKYATAADAASALHAKMGGGGATAPTTAPNQ